MGTLCRTANINMSVQQLHTINDDELAVEVVVRERQRWVSTNQERFVTGKRGSKLPLTSCCAGRTSGSASSSTRNPAAHPLQHGHICLAITAQAITHESVQTSRALPSTARRPLDQPCYQQVNQASPSANSVYRPGCNLHAQLFRDHVHLFNKKREQTVNSSTGTEQRAMADFAEPGGPVRNKNFCSWQTTS